MTQHELKEQVVYSRENGLFHSIKTGKRIGFVHDSMGKGKTKYIKLELKTEGKRKRFYAHRLAWLYEYGKFPDFTIDHIDHNGLNNKIENLRDVTLIENSRNVRRLSSNTSGFTGVWRSNNKWVAEIRVNRKKISLGSFSNIQDAVIARMKAEKEHNFHRNHGS